MKNDKGFRKLQRNTILALSLPAFLLLIVVSASGLLIPGTYYLETVNWTTQSMTQDLVDLLFVAPLLIVSAVLAARGSSRAAAIWAGVNMYLVYTFLIYSFEIHFNRLFPAYCIVLGLAFYSLLYYAGSFNCTATGEYRYLSTLRKITAFYFLFVSSFFYALWTADIVPSITSHTIPQALIETGLFTNPVHVIDLAIILPGLFLTGLMLLKEKPLGFFIAPVLLVFCTLMNVTIAALSIGMKRGGLETFDLLAWVMGSLSLFSFSLLVAHLQQFKAVLDEN